jgi:hypothetical protein
MIEEHDARMAEIAAMQKIVEVFKGLDHPAQKRILRWANDMFGATSSGADGTAHEEDQVAEEGIGNAEMTEGKASFPDLPSLFTKSSPKSGSDKVLVAGYWFQVCEGKQDLGSQELNTALKHLGHGVSNVTACMSTLMTKKPQLVMQTKKSGKTQQARKRYRLTQEGIKKVEEMTSNGGNT